MNFTNNASEFNKKSAKQLISLFDNTEKRKNYFTRTIKEHGFKPQTFNDDEEEKINNLTHNLGCIISKTCKPSVTPQTSPDSFFKRKNDGGGENAKRQKVEEENSMTPTLNTTS